MVVQHTVAAGFWLPCGPANFVDDTDPYESEMLVGLLSGKDPGVDSEIKLQSSVLRRACNVMPAFGYRCIGAGSAWTAALPVAQEAHAFSMRTVVFERSLSSAPPHLADRGQAEVFHAMWLAITEEGHYLFIARGEGREDELVAHLKNHIRAVVCSNKDLQIRRVADLKGDEQIDPVDALRSYRQSVPGLLTFFQLNILLEGLCNASFHPSVFFAGTRALTADRLHLLSTYISKLVVPVDLDNQAGLAHRQERQEQAKVARITALITPEVQARILRRFVDSSSRSTLLVMKWRLEWARRALLEETMGVLHSSSPIIQIQAPDIDGEALLEEIDDVNEAQLRGYVMLISAKVPILANVRRYLDMALKLTGDVYLNEFLFSTWSALLEAIGDNLLGLERAMEQAWRDRLLYEEEQIRAEQEALAEIERARLRYSPPETINTWLYIIGAVGTSGAVLTGLFTLGPSSTAFKAEFTRFLVIGFVLVLFVVLALMRRRFQRRDPKPTYGYEFILRLDRRITFEQAHAMLDCLGTEGQNVSLLSKYGIVFVGEPLAGSYRVERVSDEDAIFKVHYDVPTALTASNPDDLDARLRLTLIGEVLYHQPSQGGEYVYRELRGAAESSRGLSVSELDRLQQFVFAAAIRPFGGMREGADPLKGEPVFAVLRKRSEARS